MARLINTTAMTVDGVIDVEIPLAAEFGGIRSLGKETQWPTILSGNDAPSSQAH